MCAAKGTECRVLRRDETLPAWPRFSPDASKVAYVRFGGAASQLVVFSIADGKERLLGSTHWQCPPVWSSPSNVWAFEGSARGYAWVEKDVETALRTGRRVQVTENQNSINDRLDCWPKGSDGQSLAFPTVRVLTEETSSILLVPATELAR
jgi:hypothetical protein